MTTYSARGVNRIRLTRSTRFIGLHFEKMARVTSLIAAVARQVADLDRRVVVDKAKPDPEGTCQQ
jgi:hypothetical protein